MIPILHRRAVLAGWPRLKPEPPPEEPSFPEGNWVVFSTYSPGPITDYPDDFTQWGMVSGPDGTPWHITNFAGSPRGRVLRYNPFANGRAFLEIHGIGDQAEVDLLAKVNVQGGTAQDGPGLIGRWDSSQEGMYVAELFDGSHFRLPRRGPGGYDGAFSNLDVQTFPWTTGVWYYLRLQMSGTSIKATVSDSLAAVTDGQSLTPPGGWLLQGSDSTFSEGLWGLAQINASPQGYWEWVSWGADGDVAQIPPDEMHPYLEVVLADAPAAWFMMDETSGNIVDAVGTLGNGVVSGSPTYGVDGPAEGLSAIRFDGNSSFTVPHAALLNSNIMTVELWVRPTSGSSGTIPLGNMTGSFSRGNQLYRTGSTLEWWAGASGDNYLMSGSGVVPDDEWKHCVFVGDESGIRFYIDGVLIDADLADPYDGKDNTDPLYIATGLAGSPFVGDIAQVAIYDKALTEQQIQAHFAAAG